MGQQQLLLLVLGAIIVGTAIVVGITMFGESAVKSQEDAVRQDLLNMGARIQEWYRKPVQLGGGSKSFTDFDGFLEIGYRKNYDGSDASNTEYTNENGYYHITATDPPVIIGTLHEDQDIGIQLAITISAGSPNVLDFTYSDVAGEAHTYPL